jgi:hypothetical protein
MTQVLPVERFWPTFVGLPTGKYYTIKVIL